ncbi:MAG: undecaprenyl-diphosphate phosphatase [Candidatus Omnitrophica bacterium]|nr:undecaprenyl-diphosphate phosphatase [Candidatus Omnitrophota bacterium]
MTLFYAILSGVVQGLTEFLPVSSSGHLAILQHLFGIKESELFFDVCLHLGTLLAVLVYFRKDIIQIFAKKNFLWMVCIVVATIPGVAAGVLFKHSIENVFLDFKKLGWMYLITGAVLIAAHFAQKTRAAAPRAMSVWKAVFVGVAQALALFPGISRSGMTVSAGIFAGLKEEDVYKFSFILSIPIIFGAALFEMLHIENFTALKGNLLNYSAGVAASFLVGLAGIAILIKVLNSKRLVLFGIYCFCLALAIILL